MRGERSGRRGDVATKAMNAGVDPSQQDAPPTLEALKNLIGVVARSGAPQLPWRVTGAILLTLAGKGLPVRAPLVLGAAVNHLAADQGPAASVGLGFAAFAVGWAVVRFLSAATPQLSDVVFAPVRAAAQRQTAAGTLAQALIRSPDFPQSQLSG